jgi:hypothetical protein
MPPGVRPIASFKHRVDMAAAKAKKVTLTLRNRTSARTKHPTKRNNENLLPADNPRSNNGESGRSVDEESIPETPVAGPAQLLGNVNAAGSVTHTTSDLEEVMTMKGRS